MATPKSKQPVKSSQDGANRSGEKAQRKAIPSETIMKSQRLSDGTHAQPARRSTMAAEDIQKSDGTDAQPTRKSNMAAEDIKKKAEEMRRSSETTAEDMRQTGEEFTRAASTFDLKGMSKAWKQGYLHGLEGFFQSQEQTEHLLKETVTQGISGSEQILQSYEKWLEQVQCQAGAASPFVEWSRQLVRSFHTTTDPLFKTAADTTESAFNYYENALARPSRKYAIDLNKKVMDTVISA